MRNIFHLENVGIFLARVFQHCQPLITMLLHSGGLQQENSEVEHSLVMSMLLIITTVSPLDV